MALILFQRDVNPSFLGPGYESVRSYYFDPATDLTTIGSPTDEPAGTYGVMHPPVGTGIYNYCNDGDYISYTTKLVEEVGSEGGGEPPAQPSALYYLNKTVQSDSPICCDISALDFSATRTNNTSPTTPNGSISVTTSTLTIADYQASINGGATWVSPVGSSISFTDLAAGNYTVLIRELSGVCSVSLLVIITDSIVYPPLLISESLSRLPPLYAPVFYPIEIGFTLDNATATVKSDMTGTYLETATTDGRDYLATLPIIRLLGSVYRGRFQVTSVDDPGDPMKFYINAVYVSDEILSFAPFDRQVFQLLAEKASFNVFEKVADISVYPTDSGEYILRLEGFLQALFKINQPINNGDEITLLRKYYVMPRDFDMIAAPTVFNGVYSAIPDLINYLGSLIPLGPAPINFINEESGKGYPVLFSYIDLTVGRVKNVTSSDQTNIVSSDPVVYIPGIALNTYDVRWVNPAGPISSLNITPALPLWITLQSSPSDTVKLHIDTGASTGGGDYDGSDYDGNDYLVGGPNAIVGCYTYTFKDGSTTLFTLTICIYPIQSSIGECVGGFNIAWINREGGWSSYVFGGKRTYGKDIADVTTFKRGKELRRATVKNVYDTAEATIAIKSIRDLDFISSLRQSIQAYLYSDNTRQWSIPIILDRQSFTKYSTPFKAIEVNDSFKFKYAEEITIQTQ